MRVISGSAKGIRLSSVPGKSTRPITDRVKEALFNILGSTVVGTSILDLFGGTGAVGIEALSRGASHAHFLDTNFRAFRTIQENLKTTRLEASATILKRDAFVYLHEEDERQFDLIYIAPPQYKDLWIKAMQILDDNPGLLNLDGIVIVQIHPKEYKETVVFRNFQPYDERNYGDTRLIFYDRVSMQ
ncbi:MAG: 16S rRNA (guanine(966)-N(2))-methyltransferase RsmD [Chloroflexota bacterium]|nr:16S rRNA (guanine(966)-N(2))-methyltransferase RsmD [Chloroflexota bacterium]